MARGKTAARDPGSADIKTMKPFPKIACSDAGWILRTLKPLSAVFFALGLLACKPAVPTGSAEPWGSFNGFYPGMSLEAAKAAGAHDCKDGDLGAKKITCSFPAEKMKLGEFNGIAGSLNFFARQEHRLTEMHVSFAGQHFNYVCQAMAKQYGQPIRAIAYAWHKAGEPVFITMPRRSVGGSPLNALVTIRFDPDFADPKHDSGGTTERGCDSPD